MIASGSRFKRRARLTGVVGIPWLNFGLRPQSENARDVLDSAGSMMSVIQKSVQSPGSLPRITQPNSQGGASRHLVGVPSPCGL